MVTLRGIVFDSLVLMPLRNAEITLSAADTVTAVSDTNGMFVVSLRSGIWRAAVAHPRFDSLRLAIPVRQLEVPARNTVEAKLWTPSRRTVTRMLCGDSVRRDDAALVGIVRDATTRNVIDSASVIVQWINLTLHDGSFVRSTETHSTRTLRGGWYVSCGVPANGMLLSWAEHNGATSGPISLTLEGASVRLDLSVDSTARLATAAADTGIASRELNPFPTAAGRARYRVFVSDNNGRPQANVWVDIVGQRTARTNEAGMATLDSLVGGTQTLELRAMGYLPQRRLVDVAPNRIPIDTVVLASARTMLDTIRVVAGRDPTGFERRRATAAGQFITAADVEREAPKRTTQLLRTRDGLRFKYDRNGFPYIEVTTQTSGCKPLVLLDGFLTKEVPMAPGHAAMDWHVHPDEIGGVEIYTISANIPPELARWGWGQACATIAFWTRKALGLPKSASFPR